jgi:hypothetical protein
MHATITSYTARRYAQQLVYGLAPLLLLLAGASSAVAASCVPSADVYTVDTKVFPATMCRQIGSTNTVYYDGHGRLLNPSTTAAVTVICPIVRDASRDKWASVHVVVADRNPNANVTCAARSNQTDGLGWSSGPTNPLPTGFYDLNAWASQTLTFGPQADERDDGTYFVSCTLPPRYYLGISTTAYDSGIYSYRIREYAGCTNPD